jgi:hypothetical protein
LSASAALALAGCGLDIRYDAAEDVHAFMVAARDGDDTAFERHVDREALRADIRRKLEEKGGPEAQRLSRMLSRRGGEDALDRMITPDSFRIVVQGAGASRIPSRVEIAAGLRMIDPDTVCLRDGRAPNSCAMTFQKQGDAWRLVSLQPGEVQVTTMPEPRG